MKQFAEEFEGEDEGNEFAHPNPKLIAGKYADYFAANIRFFMFENKKAQSIDNFEMVTDSYPNTNTLFINVLIDRQ